MISILSKSVVNSLIKQNFINSTDADIYTYGMESIISYFISILIIITIGLFTNRLFDCILYQGVFFSLRSYTGGYHAPGEYRCWGLSSLLIIVVVFLLDYIPARLPASIALYILFFAAVIIMALAPIKHENNPLTRADVKRYKNRTKITLAIITVACFCLYISHNMYTLWVITLALLSVSLSMIVGLFSNRLKFKTSIF